MSTSPANTGVKHDAMTEYYDFAKRLAATIKRIATERERPASELAVEALDDAEFMAWLYRNSLRGTEADRISMQDTTNIVNCVASGELRV